MAWETWSIKPCCTGSATGRSPVITVCMPPTDLEREREIQREWLMDTWKWKQLSSFSPIYSSTDCSDTISLKEKSQDGHTVKLNKNSYYFYTYRCKISQSTLWIVQKVKNKTTTNKPPSHFAWSCDSWILWMFSYPDHLTVKKPSLILIKISKSAIRPCMDTLACELTHIRTQQAIREPSYNPSSQELVDVAKSFLERRKERMTERQMLRGLRGISVFLTLIHWHISVGW